MHDLKHAPEVEVKRADASQKPVVYNLLQIYLHHFAGLTKPEAPEWRFNAFGQFDYPDFNSYWGDKRRHPYLIYAGGQLAGFALVNRSSASGKPADFFMQEFFIGGKYRGRGIGTDAVRQIVRHHPGQWELGTVPGNEAVIDFWRRALACPEVRNLEQFPGDNVRWTGAIFRFST
jgi:predicted acetyltransferase